MTVRKYLRASEVPILFGLDKNMSEWALWNSLREGQSSGIGDYGRWQARLMTPIMQGIAEDHGLRIERALEPAGCAYQKIMPPRAWEVAPNLLTNGERAALVIQQRSEASLREWKEPDNMPEKARMRYKAIATAFDVPRIIVGILVDGYGSRIYHVQADEIAKKGIRDRIDQFISDVENDEEPEIDFTKDATSIRSGATVAKAEASADRINEILTERAALLMERPPADANLKRIESRLKEIDTLIIHIASKSGKIDTGDQLVTIERDGKGTPKVTVVNKKPMSLF